MALAAAPLLPTTAPPAPATGTRKGTAPLPTTTARGQLCCRAQRKAKCRGNPATVVPRTVAVPLQVQAVSRSPGSEPRLSPREDLAATLWGAILNQQRQLAQSALQGAADTLESAWKFLQPLPAGMPPGPPSDAGVDLIADPLHFIDDVTKRYGRAVGLKIAGEPVVLISDPDLAKEVLVTQSDVFVKAGTAFFPGSSLAGNGLLVSDGEVWRRQRRLSNPAFRKSAIASYSQAMIQLTEDMVQRTWHAGGVRDVYRDFNDLTLDITIAALFGGLGTGSGSSSSSSQSTNNISTTNQSPSNSNSSRSEPGPRASSVAESSSSASARASLDPLLADVGPAISTAFTFFSRRATTAFAIPEWLPTPDNIQYNLAVAQLDRVIYRLIADRRRQLAMNSGLQEEEPSPEASSDLLTQLLQARDEDGSDMDDVALRDELMTLLVAGQETSAILLAWTCAMLALHPGAQSQLQAEVDEVLGKRTPSHRDVMNMPFLEATIWETLRLMPPAYLVGRCTSRDTTLGSWKLPQGTTTLVSPYLLHRDPQFWPRAEEFDPSRWLPGGSALPQAVNDSYWPFGGGPRNCIGMGFAMMEAELAVAIIMQNVSLRLPPGGQKPQPRALITLRPEGRVDLLLERR